MFLIDYLPSFYKNCDNVSSIMDAQNIEIEKIRYAILDLTNQFFLDTATWGLDLWEEEFGIVIDKSKSYEERREFLKSKKRGQGTVTKKMIKQVAESFSGGEVEVIEITNQYKFIIKFIGALGIPKNIDDFISIIEEIKPAHLAYSFEYTYITWNDLDKFNYTWDVLDNKNLTWDELETHRSKGVI